MIKEADVFKPFDADAASKAFAEMRGLAEQRPVSFAFAFAPVVGVIIAALLLAYLYYN